MWLTFCLMLYQHWATLYQTIQTISQLITAFLREVKHIFKKQIVIPDSNLQIYSFFHTIKLITLERNSLIPRICFPVSSRRNITFCALCGFLFSLKGLYCAILSSIICMPGQLLQIIEGVWKYILILGEQHNSLVAVLTLQYT